MPETVLQILARRLHCFPHVGRGSIHRGQFRANPVAQSAAPHEAADLWLRTRSPTQNKGFADHPPAKPPTSPKWARLSAQPRGILTRLNPMLIPHTPAGKNLVGQYRQANHLRLIQHLGRAADLGVAGHPGLSANQRRA